MSCGAEEVRGTVTPVTARTSSCLLWLYFEVCGEGYFVFYGFECWVFTAGSLWLWASLVGLAGGSWAFLHHSLLQSCCMPGKAGEVMPFVPQWPCSCSPGDLLSVWSQGHCGSQGEMGVLKELAWFDRSKASGRKTSIKKWSLGSSQGFSIHNPRQAVGGEVPVRWKRCPGAPRAWDAHGGGRPAQPHLPCSPRRLWAAMWGEKSFEVCWRQCVAPMFGSESSWARRKQCNPSVWWHRVAGQDPALPWLLGARWAPRLNFPLLQNED